MVANEIPNAQRRGFTAHLHHRNWRKLALNRLWWVWNFKLPSYLKPQFLIYLTSVLLLTRLTTMFFYSASPFLLRSVRCSSGLHGWNPVYSIWLDRFWFYLLPWSVSHTWREPLRVRSEHCGHWVTDPSILNTFDHKRQNMHCQWLPLGCIEISKRSSQAVNGV